MQINLIQDYCKKYSNSEWLSQKIDALNLNEAVHVLSLVNQNRTLGLCAWKFRADLEKASQNRDNDAFNDIIKNVSEYTSKLDPNLQQLQVVEMDYIKSNLNRKFKKVSLVDIYKFKCGDINQAIIKSKEHEIDLIHIPIHKNGRRVVYVYELIKIIPQITSGECPLPLVLQEKIMSKYKVEFDSYLKQ